MATWAELVEVFQDGGLRTQLTEDMLRQILTLRRAEPSVPWIEAILLLLWRRLISLHKYKRRWDSDEDSRWANILWAFLVAVRGIDPETRPKRLGQKILNDTAHRLHDHYAGEWKRARREVATDPRDLLPVADPRPGIDFDGIELRQAQRSELARLRRLRTRGRISDADYFLQVGTRIYGRDLAECAADVGLGYEVAKKRCQRMRARVDPNRRR